MPHYVVTVKRLNKRTVVPEQFPDRSHIIGELVEGQGFDGDEVDIAQIPNPALGKWYRDRDNHFYWGGGLTEALVENRFLSVPQQEIDRFLSIAKFPPTNIDWQKILHLPENIKRNLGNNIKIAVLDTGIDKSHLDLTPNIILEKDFTGSGFGTTDIIGHGTLMTSFIAARSFFGNKGVSGIAPAAKIIPAKVMYEENDPQDFLSVGKGIEYAIEQRADIVSMSIGNNNDVPSIAAIIKNAAVSNRILFVAATRQFDQALPLLQFPANCPDVIVATAMTEDFVKTNWNLLPSPLIIFPQIKCWGCSIKDANYYADDLGSSIATAMLSGIIALLLSNDPSLKKNKQSILAELSKFASSVEDTFADPENDLRFIYKP